MKDLEISLLDHNFTFFLFENTGTTNSENSSITMNVNQSTKFDQLNLI
jgi:hypothetical protein